MASPFSYDPLRGAQFRLLRLGPAESHDSSASPDTENVSICCDISNHDLDQHPEYTALSYTWGTGEPSKAILLNGTLFPVRDNLYQLWWIDAICINQDDISERSSQVALMRRIYRQASRIVIWLGPAADDSDQAFEACRSYMDTAFCRKDAERLSWYETVPKLAMEKLAMRSWWERVWVWQEATTPHVPSEFWCGGHRASFDDVHHTYTAIRVLNAGSDDGLTPYNSNIVTMRVLKMDREIRKPGHDLYWLFHQATTLAATDPRDRIYALLPIWEEMDKQGAKSIPIDYNMSSEEVFHLAAVYVLRASSSAPRILQECMCNIDGTFGSFPPSWVPDRSQEARMRPWRSFVSFFSPDPVVSSAVPVPEFDAAVSVSDDMRTLTLRAAFLGTIARTSPRYPFHRDDLLSREPAVWDAHYRSKLRELAEMAFPSFVDHPYVAGGLKKSEAIDQLLTFKRQTKYRKAPPPPHWPVLEIANFDYSHLINAGGVYQTASRTFIYGMKFLTLFETQEGFLGAAMPGARTGDVLVGIPGISTPVLLRQEGKSWRIVCCSLVVGLSGVESWGGADVKIEEYCIV